MVKRITGMLKVPNVGHIKEYSNFYFQKSC